ncbi:MAG: response regulator transcription factor [Clostridium sp.]|nr:response regulator transcription factor [Clostridium sp.]
MGKGHVLLGEDEPDILEFNREQLEQRGYRVTAVSTLEQVEDCVFRDEPDVLVLDIMMPDGSGVELCRKLRQQFRGPILFLTSLGESSQIVQGLRAGGDDYITKPYDIEVLAARIEAQLRRRGRMDVESCAQKPGGLYLNLKSQRAYLKGRDLLLKPKEYRLLTVLARNKGRYVVAEELYREIWNMSPNQDLRTVWVHISNLRKKLQGNQGEGVADIECKRSLGYRLVIMDAEDEKSGGE